MSYIHLTAFEESALKKLHKTSGNSVVRKRYFLLLYSNRNHSIQETCAVGGIHRRTLERFFTKWESNEGKEKFQFLSVAAGRGAKLKLEPLKEKSSDLVKEHNRNLNPLLHLLETQYHIKVRKSTLQAFLKKNMGYSWKRARLSLKMFRNQERFDKQQQEIKSLMKLDKKDYIDLYFGDESHFGLVPNVPYAWQHKDDPLLLPCEKSQKLSVFGLINPDCKFYSHTTTGSLTSKVLIGYLDEFVQGITKRTILVLDNAPIHRSEAFNKENREMERVGLVYLLSTSIFTRAWVELKYFGDLSNTSGCLWRRFLTSKNSKKS